MNEFLATRRAAIINASRLMTAPLVCDAVFGSVEDPRQHGWRFCSACSLMFHGPTQAGSCPAGGQHQPAGYQFALYKRLTEETQREPAPPQDKWRKCRNCASLFYNGYPQKGLCATKRAHIMDPATQFLLSHDRMPRRKEQADWRFCRKCHGLFFDGSPKKGVCAGGGEHEKAGYMFLLPYD